MAHRNRWSRWSKGWFTYSKTADLPVLQNSSSPDPSLLDLGSPSPKGSQAPTENQPRPVSFVHPIPWQHALPAWSLRPPAAPNGDGFSGWFMNHPWKKIEKNIHGVGLGLWIGHRKIGPCKLKITWKHLVNMQKHLNLANEAAGSYFKSNCVSNNLKNKSPGLIRSIIGWWTTIRSIRSNGSKIRSKMNGIT